MSNSRSLVVKTLNLQYYASYPENEEAAESKLNAVLYEEGAVPDVICVQEGLGDRNVLAAMGYDLKVCSARAGEAQTVHDMVYGDEAALRGCSEASHSQLLCNQIYLRRNTSWEVKDSGAVQISSNLELKGCHGRSAGKLATRSMVWAKLQKEGLAAVYVMCTHLTGGRFEDQYFVQQLAEERFRQVENIVDFFDSSRPNPQADDVAILVGDFNATTEYIRHGPMSKYFQFALADSQGVKADAKSAGLELGSDLEARFEKYMLSPFAAIDKYRWSYAYGKEVGITSKFGHLIDHMATSGPVTVTSTRTSYLTNPMFGDVKHTDVQLTDHNAVTTSFEIGETCFENKQLRMEHVQRSALVEDKQMRKHQDPLRYQTSLCDISLHRSASGSAGYLVNSDHSQDSNHSHAIP